MTESNHIDYKSGADCFNRGDAKPFMCTERFSLGFDMAAHKQARKN